MLEWWHYTITYITNCPRNSNQLHCNSVLSNWWTWKIAKLLRLEKQQQIIATLLYNLEMLAVIASHPVAFQSLLQSAMSALDKCPLSPVTNRALVLKYGDLFRVLMGCQLQRNSCYLVHATRKRWRLFSSSLLYVPTLES